MATNGRIAHMTESFSDIALAVAIGVALGLGLVEALL